MRQRTIIAFECTFSSYLWSLDRYLSSGRKEKCHVFSTIDRDLMSTTIVLSVWHHYSVCCKNMVKLVRDALLSGPVLSVCYISMICLRLLSHSYSSTQMMQKIFREIHCRQDVDQLQLDLHRLCDWSRKWLLQFHISKCKVVHFGKSLFDTQYC